MKIDPECLAYWYLRLNGFLTITNFLVHAETKRDRSTEVDILAVRFPFRAENLTRPMIDDKIFTEHGERICLVIAEVKSGRCELNGPWRDPKARNMEKVLAAIGMLPQSCMRTVADSLYQSGYFQDDKHLLSLLCIGRYPNEALLDSLSLVHQVTFDHMLRFIHGRLVEYLNVKVQHEQWDRDGKALWDTVNSNPGIEDFLRVVCVGNMECSTNGRLEKGQ